MTTTAGSPSVLAGLTADLIVTKSLYTDTFARARTAAPMSLSAHMQWQTLPPLVMTTPDVALAGILEPSYDVGGDSFDYALNDHVLHLAVFDAMGHGLEAATMATIVLATYRHGRRSSASLPDLYVHMDDVLSAYLPGAVRHRPGGPAGHRDRPAQLGERRPPRGPADPRERSGLRAHRSDHPARRLR